jgi:hypothetical protein
VRILDAIADPELFAPFLGEDHTTWDRWFSALKCLYGLSLNRQDRNLIRECTGRRNIRNLPPGGFTEALFLTGRRSGKSRTAALIGAFEAVCGGHERKLAPGEQGLVAIFAPTRNQANIVFGYLKAVFDSTPMLRGAVVHSNTSRFDLTNGISVAVITGDHRSARGFTLVCAICDELAFFGVTEDVRTKSDTELVRGLKPSLATTGGKLIGITTPWIKSGYVYRAWKRNHGNDTARVLVWKSPSRVMNPTLPQQVVDDAMAEDPTAARSEYFAEFREGAVQFIPPEIVEPLVVRHRLEALPNGACQNYVAFWDASGGRSDSAALAIAHAEGDRLILDLLKEFEAPHNPHTVVRIACGILGVWGIPSVIGDRYAAGFVDRAFNALGRSYEPSSRSKSDIYLEALPLLCSGQVELLDNSRLVEQLTGLIRLTRTGGKDIVDHPPGGKDDLSNAAMGAIVNAGLPEGSRCGLVFSVRDTSPVQGDRVRSFVNAIMSQD